MKNIFLFIVTVILLACNRKVAAPETGIAHYVEKIRSFTFVNADSVKYYNTLLKKKADPAVPEQNAFLNYADGLYFLTIGVHNKALENLREASDIFKREKSDSCNARCLVGMANCYKLMGEPDQAIFHFLEAVTIFMKTGDRKFLTVCYVNIAETYQQKNDIRNTQKYLALAKANEPYGSKIYTGILHLEANVFGMNGITDSALITDREGIALSTKNNYPDKLSSFYDNIARCYIIEKKYDSAEFYYHKCITADSANGRLQLMADTYAQMVNLYGSKKQEAKMLSTAKYALSLCDSTQYLRGKFAVYEGLNNYYTENRRWEQLAEVKDSLQYIDKQLINRETEQKIAEYNAIFETSQKEKIITEQHNDLQKATYLTVLLSALALMLIVSIFVLYRNYRTRKMMAVNKAIQQQKDINTQAVFESEQAERIRIARDLHDSLGQKLSVLKMYFTSRDHDDERTSVLLDDTIAEVRNISHDLLPEELNFGLLKAISNDIDKWKNAASFKVISNIEPSAQYDKISLLNSLNIVRILRELLHNYTSHSKASQVNINLSVQDNIFALQIKDDGMSIDQKAIAESRGIGWKNIHARANMLKGSVNIENNILSGNIISIKIPVA